MCGVYRAFFAARFRTMGQTDIVGILGGANGAAVLRPDGAPYSFGGDVSRTKARVAVRAVLEVSRGSEGGGRG